MLCCFICFFHECYEKTDWVFVVPRRGDHMAPLMASMSGSNNRGDLNRGNDGLCFVVRKGAADNDDGH